MSMDPHTGHIKAWVGGPNYEYFKYDQVKTGKRQVGSTFKPLVYTVAMDNGWSPCFEAPNLPIVFEDFDNWSPKNSDGKEGGMMTLRMGLANSVNLITAYMMKQVGPQAVVNVAKKMGITGIDLVGPEAWPTLKKHNLVSTMCNGAELNLVDGFNDIQFHEKLIQRYTEMIPRVAEAGYKNLICFSGNRRGKTDEEGWNNCVIGLQKLIPLAEKYKVSRSTIDNIQRGKSWKHLSIPSK